MRLIDPGTGMLANEWCPVKKREYFKPGTEPTERVQRAHGAGLRGPGRSRSTWRPGPRDPIERGVDGIGKVLRKIFRF